MKKIILLLTFITLISCGKDDKITLVGSTGRINHVLIVIKNSDWQGDIGDALRDVITKPIDGLPQEEYQFSITQVAPKTFNNLFKRTRNILFVGFSDEDNFYTNKNVYAEPQLTVTLLANSEEEIIKSIYTNKEKIISIFKDNDLALYQKKITKDFYEPKIIETFKQLDFTFKIPTSYNKVEDTGNFLWYKNTLTTGLLNIIAYEIPRSDTFDLDFYIKYRDSIGQKYIPGQFDSTYMKTETRLLPVMQKTILSNKKATELRGLWFVEGDYMGGPFISYAIDDKKNNRLLILEGFCYYPASKKRDLIFEMEAILKTVQLN